MHRKKILIFLIVIAVLLLAYLVLSSETILQNENSVDQNILIDKEIMTSDYKRESARIISDYYYILSSKQTNIDQIRECKKKLLDLKVPSEYKDLHIQLVLAVTKMETYLLDKDEREWSESLEMINKAMADNAWLRK